MNTNLHDLLFQSLTQAPGGKEWEKLLAARADLDFYLAGGCVRDELLQRGKPSKDFDIFVGGKSVESLLEHLAAVGKLEHGPFGSPRWYPNPENQFYYDAIPIKRFINGLWHCEDITDVLNQFDFTANAVAVNLRTGEFSDPQNGKRDIEQRIMRAVRFDYPDEPIAAGILLNRPEVVWFRILHYAAVLKFKVEPVTLRWLMGNRHYESLADRFASTFFPLHPRWRDNLLREP